MNEHLSPTRNLKLIFSCGTSQDKLAATCERTTNFSQIYFNYIGVLVIYLAGIMYHIHEYCLHLSPIRIFFMKLNVHGCQFIPIGALGPCAPHDEFVISSIQKLIYFDVLWIFHLIIYTELSRI